MYTQRGKKEKNLQSSIIFFVAGRDPLGRPLAAVRIRAISRWMNWREIQEPTSLSSRLFLFSIVSLSLSHSLSLSLSLSPRQIHYTARLSLNRSGVDPWKSRSLNLLVLVTLKKMNVYGGKHYTSWNRVTGAAALFGIEWKRGQSARNRIPAGRCGWSMGKGGLNGSKRSRIQ